MEVERAVEVPVTVEVERAVEVPVTVEVERAVEVPVTVEVERAVEVPVTVEVERMVEVPVTVEVERIVEVPVTVEVERIVEVPVTVETVREVEVVREIEVPALIYQDISVVELPNSVFGYIDNPWEPAWYKFTAIVRQRYIFESSPLDSNFCTILLLLYDVGGLGPAAAVELERDLGSGSEPCASRIEWTAPKNGEYILGVSGERFDNTGNFKLRYGFWSPIPDSPSALYMYEGNDVRITWSPVSGATYYRVDVQDRSGGRLLLETDITATQYIHEHASDVIGYRVERERVDESGQISFDVVVDVPDVRELVWWYGVYACNDLWCSSKR